MVKVTIKWNRQVHDLDVDTSLSATVFKAQLSSLTGVPIERQRLMGLKGGPLKDDVDLNQIGLIDGMKLMLFGTAEGCEFQVAEAETAFGEEAEDEESSGAEEGDLFLKIDKMGSFPTGLINLGNTCYLNSIMQFLRPSQELTEIIKSFPGELGSTDADEKLCATFRRFYEAREMTDESLPPLLIIEALRSRYPQFASRSRTGESYAQQDADECLSALLTTFSRKNSKTDDIFAFKFETILKNLEDPAEPEIRKWETVRLLCCHMGTQLNPVDHLHQGIKLSLDETLTKRSETLERDCQYSKTMRIASLPPYLVINFVRFEWKRASDSSRTGAGRAKVCRKVQFSLTFDVHEFCSDELKKKLQVGRYVLADRVLKEGTVRMETKSDVGTHISDSNSSQLQPINNRVDDHDVSMDSSTPSTTLTSGQYELQSIVTHQGRSADSGHYVAWTRKNDEIWYKFDDDTVSELRWKDIDLAGGRGDFHIAVLLMYRQKTFSATGEEVREAETRIAEEDARKAKQLETKAEPIRAEPDESSR